MPLLRTETVHGVVCKSYDGDIVKVGTTAAGRFTIKVPSDEESWFPTRLRAELVKRELAIAAELAVDETGEAAMAAKAAAAKEEADKRAAWKQAVAEDRVCPKRKAEAALEAARLDEVRAETNTLRAEKACHDAQINDAKAKAAKVVAGIADLAQTEPKLAPIKTSLEAWLAVYRRIEPYIRKRSCT